MTKFSRRDMLRWSLCGAGGLMLQSLATGLPVSFLRSGNIAHAQAATNNPTFLLIAASSAGDPLNANCPGSYPNPNDMNDLRHRVDHATTAELGTGSYGTVGGVAYGAADFETGYLCRLGDQDTYAAKPWADLPQGLRDRMSVIRHRTFTNAHPEYRNVSEFHGSVKGPGRVGVESLPSFIAQETSSLLGTTIEKPIHLAGPNVLYQGTPLRKQDPDSLHSLFAETGDFNGLQPDDLADFRDAALDAIYQDVRLSGTPAQRKFIDDNARSRSAARVLSDALAPSLAPIANTNNGLEKQILAAIALFEHNVTPVATMSIPFGGDNHQDGNLEVEVTQQIAGIDAIHKLWVELEARGLQDRVTFAILNVFGRTLQRQNSGGRNHYGDDHAMVMFGPHVQPGLLGQLIDTGDNKRPFKAGPIEDVPVEETLATAGKTLARATGVPDDIIETRIVGGRAF